MRSTECSSSHCICYREDESADALDDVGTVVGLDDDVEVHDDPLVVFVVARTSHLLQTQTDNKSTSSSLN